MTRFAAAYALISACCLFAAGVDAQESMNLGRPAAAPMPPMTVEYPNGQWEVHFYWGHIIPLKKATFSHDIPNEKVFDLLAGEAVGDEVAEGFVMPPIPGSSNVADSLKNFSEVGVQVLYAAMPWLQVGGQFGYGIKRDPYVDSRGIYTPDNFLKIDVEANLYHLNAPIRAGTWFGRFRPHVSVAPGIYFVEENIRAAFNDSDDPQLKPQLIFSKQYQFFGVGAGAGLDVRVFNRGRVSLGCEYHKVFAPMSKFDFIMPKAELSVGF